MFLTKVGQSRESKWVISRRPDGFGSSEFRLIVYLLMLNEFRWVSGSDYGFLNSFLASEGSNERVVFHALSIEMGLTQQLILDKN